MGHCGAVGIWNSGQLFRSGKSFGIKSSAARCVWDVSNAVWSFVERIQLAVRGVATSFWIAAGPVWGAASRHRKHNYLGGCIVCGGGVAWREELVWRANFVGGWRSAGVSGNRESDRILVSEERTQHGYGDVRFDGEIFFGRWDSRARNGAGALWLAGKLCSDWDDQRDLFGAVSEVLPESEPGRGAIGN